MKQKIDRREFLKLTGLFAGTISLGLLPSCGKNEEANKISLNDLKRCHIVNLEDSQNSVILVKYSKNAHYFVITMFNTSNDVIIEVEMCRGYADEKEEIINDFYQNYNVTNDKLALSVFEKQFGLKDFYTIDEINCIFEIEKIKSESQKTIKK